MPSHRFVGGCRPHFARSYNLLAGDWAERKMSSRSGWWRSPFVLIHSFVGVDSDGSCAVCSGCYGSLQLDIIQPLLQDLRSPHPHYKPRDVGGVRDDTRPDGRASSRGKDRARACTRRRTRTVRLLRGQGGFDEVRHNATSNYMHLQNDG